MFNNRRYDVNDLITVIREIFNDYLGARNVGVYDRFDSDLRMDTLTKNRIILAIEHVLNYSLSVEEKSRINSIHDVLLVYKSALDREGQGSDENQLNGQFC